MKDRPRGKGLWGRDCGHSPIEISQQVGGCPRLLDEPAIPRPVPPHENWGHSPIEISQQVGGCPRLLDEPAIPRPVPPHENWGHPPIETSQQVGGCPRLLLIETSQQVGGCPRLLVAVLFVSIGRHRRTSEDLRRPKKTSGASGCSGRVRRSGPWWSVPPLG